MPSYKLLLVCYNTYKCTTIGRFIIIKGLNLRYRKFYLNFGETETADDPGSDPFVYGLSDQGKHL